jgi:hypothetical protein
MVHTNHKPEIKCYEKVTYAGPSWPMKRAAFSAVFSGRNAGSDKNLARHYYPLYLASRFPLPVHA